MSGSGIRRLLVCHMIAAMALLGAVLQLSGPANAKEPKPGNQGVVPITLVGPFTDYHRAKILQAINEWNMALNHQLRFDMQAHSTTPGIWTIVAMANSPYRSGPEALALTTPFRAGGGLVIVYLDRIGSRDLGFVMLHELGHVLGLKHDVPGRLMSATYNAHDQKCVDYPALAEVAMLHHLMVSEMRWCGVVTAR